MTGRVLGTFGVLLNLLFEQPSYLGKIRKKIYSKIKKMLSKFHANEENLRITWA